jgi:xanthine dehydrogenase accessory factor
MLAGKTTEAVLDIPLGPEIGQCCGGRTLLRFTPVTSGVEQAIKQRLHDQQKCQPAVFIFGAGHVGKALAAALSLLPLTVTVIETRRGELEGLPDDIKTHVTPMPEALVKTIPSHGVVIIVTHDHALDFLIAREALARSDLSYVGMIGSKTKRATFTHWMQREGEERHRLDRLILPIGGAAVRDKRPTVIAAMVTAEILTTLSRVEAPELEPAIDQNPISGA